MSHLIDPATLQRVADIADGLLTACLWTDAQPADSESLDAETGGMNDTHTVTLAAQTAALTYAAAFYARHPVALEAYADLRSYDPNDGNVWQHIGHDLYLSASGHGIGFRDRDTGDVGDFLSSAVSYELDGFTLYAIDADTCDVDVLPSGFPFTHQVRV